MHADSITDLVPTAISGTEQMTGVENEGKAEIA